MDKGANFLWYASVPSLQVTAMTKIVIRLWELQCSEETIDFSLIDYRRFDEYNDYEESEYRSVRYHGYRGMEKKVLRKLLALQLPKEVEQEIVRYIMPIGQHLLGWLDPENFSLALPTLSSISWTHEGTVDEEKTLRSIFDRYKGNRDMFLAVSKACLEDLVVEAWKKMPERLKNIDSVQNRKLCKKLAYDYHLVMYWICFCKGELSRLMGIVKKTDHHEIYEDEFSLHRNMLNLSVLVGNKLAVKYFWQKLSEDEKDIEGWMLELMPFLIAWDHVFDRRTDGMLEVWVFLLGQMKDCEEQESTFESYGGEFLESIIHNWPWQKYLVQTVSTMSSFVEETEFIEFMSALVANIKKGRMTEKLFDEIWCVTPLSLKTCFAKAAMEFKEMDSNVFDNLFDICDLDTVKMIMNLASVENRKEFLISYAQSDNFVRCAYYNSAKIDNFLKEMLPSKNDFAKCKRLYTKVSVRNVSSGRIDVSKTLSSLLSQLS